MSAYDEGYAIGQYRKTHGDYDVRYDLADHAKAGTLKEFQRGLHDAIDGKEAQP